MAKAIDEAASFLIGAGLAALVQRGAAKYGDTNPSMNMDSLPYTAGRPSTYVPLVTGTGALYAASKVDKMKLGKNRDSAEAGLIGYGVFALVDSLRTIGIAAMPVGATRMRVAPGRGAVMQRQLIQPQTMRAANGYPAEANGSRRGMI